MILFYMELASKKKIRIAWSNDSIELWFILHYQYLQTTPLRNQYFQILEKIWNLEESYESLGKKKAFCTSLYKGLLPKQKTAIYNATKLYELHSNTYPISRRNPCTTVFILVKELNKYLKK